MIRPGVIGAAVLGGGLVVLACGGGSAASTPTTPTTTTTTPAVSGVNTTAMYTQFGNAVTVSIEGTTAVLRTTDVPNHPSPYFGAGNALYEAPQPGMQVAPGVIQTQNIVMRVPLVPQSATASDTPLGPIGVAVNGVTFFNQYAAGRQPLGSGEIGSFDRFNGHPTPTNQYHYHVEPLWITAKVGRGGLIGVLLDGFPVYGPLEGGKLLVSADLDALHGHTGATAQFPNGIYHYHVTADSPYINGSGFKGTPGTVGR